MAKRWLSFKPKINEFGIRMIPSSLSKLLFKNVKHSQPILTELARLHLDLHQIPWKSAADQTHANHDPDNTQHLLSFCEFPALKGADLDEHFRCIARELNSSWFDRASSFCLSPLPSPPDFSTLPSSALGWLRYDSLNKTWASVSNPPSSEDLIFDIETCPRISKHSILAVAVSVKAWYIWISPMLGEAGDRTSANLLIPFGKDHLIIGHNISYDRARIAEEYSLDLNTNINFIDTMALHCAVAGLSNQQRTLWLKHRKIKKAISKNIELDDDIDAGIDDTRLFSAEDDVPALGSKDSSIDSKMPNSISGYAESCLGRWLFHSAPNSLVEATAFHCKEPIATKDDRTFLIHATELDEVKAKVVQLLRYCANDVMLTSKLFKAVWPKFVAYNTHPATFSGMLMMGKMILTSDAGWYSWISECETQLSSFSKKLEDNLNNLALQIISCYSKDDAWKKDPWLKHLDWTPVPAKYCLLPKPKKSRQRQTDNAKSPAEKDIEDVREYDYNRPIGNPLFFGQPAWYKELWNPSKKKVVISPRMTIVPYLLGMTWHNFPLRHLGVRLGWHYELSCGSYIPMPCPEGRVTKSPDSAKEPSIGTVISKGFFPAFKNGTLKATRCPELAELAFEACTEFSFWTAYRSRVCDTLAVQLNNEKNAIAILPQMCPMGTITRRATDRLWLTSTSSSKSSVLGSDLKSRMIAPDGWKFVGADVDAQELWISSLFGDAQFGKHGSTALSWMGLAGNKLEGTDLHSKTATLLGGGATRELAKIFNYARFYGSGVKFASTLLHSTQPHLTKEECDQRVAKMYRQTKGIPSLSRANLLMGGSESFMFNSLAALALGHNFSLVKGGKHIKKVQTPVLRCQITDALSPWSVGEGSQFSTTRMNWIVQSSAVDYLHLLLTGMAWLAKIHKIRARLAITIHDEVRWLVKEEDAIRAAIALQIANLWTRAAFSEALGMPDLPLSVAFFSSVEIDNVLRKDPKSPCLSPTRQDPLPPGLSFSFTQLIEERRREIGKQSGSLSVEDLLGPKGDNSASASDSAAFHNTPKCTDDFLSSFVPDDVQERVAVILAQEEFTSHPEYKSKIQPLLYTKKSSQTQKTRNVQRDEFGDIVRRPRKK